MTLRVRIGYRFALAFTILATRLLVAQTFPALEPAGKTLANGVAPGAAELSAKAALEESFGKLPLSFEVNQGQTDQRVKFLSRGSGYTLFLTGSEAVFALSESHAQNKLEQVEKPLTSQARLPLGRKLRQGEVVRMQLASANPTWALSFRSVSLK
jgi:hypothetical protein